jgi:RHH-type transcriptional regulator, rel operon repressor / antitoxin RelB
LLAGCAGLWKAEGWRSVQKRRAIDGDMLFEYIDYLYSKRNLLMPTSVRLSPETEKRIDLLAAQSGRTKAYYLRELVERSLEDVEDYYLAEAVLERIRKGEETVHSLADVERELGLDN